jgi:hypothetical protein
MEKKKFGMKTSALDIPKRYCGGRKREESLCRFITYRSLSDASGVPSNYIRVMMNDVIYTEGGYVATWIVGSNSR